MKLRALLAQALVGLVIVACQPAVEEIGTCWDCVGGANWPYPEAACVGLGVCWVSDGVGSCCDGKACGEPEPSGACCLCKEPGASPAWCGLPAESDEACGQLGEGLEEGWLEWHEECDASADACPGVCGQ